MTNTPIKPKPKPVRKIVRAGLLLNPTIIAKIIRKHGRGKDFRLGKGADVFVAAAVQSVIGELAEVCVEIAKNHGAKRVSVKHISEALQVDPILAKQLVPGIIPNGLSRGHQQQIGYSDRKKEKKVVEA